jgi:hypothetical protein
MIVEGETGFRFPTGNVAALVERLMQATQWLKGPVGSHNEMVHNVANRHSLAAAACGLLNAIDRTLEPIQAV